MIRNKSDVQDEDIGLRQYHLQKEKAVERAMEKIRQQLSSSWQMMKREDIELLSWALGEIWALHRRTDWEELSFSLIKLADVIKIVKIADQVVNNEKPGYKGLNEINQILVALRAPSEEKSSE